MSKENAERRRLENQRLGIEDWRLWGPYLAERAWGTVREDYSATGEAWEHFDHDQARSRAYRWSEDGLGGICDAEQRLCLALALWNGRDPILKERAFGLTGNQGNRGEDVKERYFYLDATPSHSHLRYLYRYPQGEYPYAELVAENERRGREEPPFDLRDHGVWEAGFWDVTVTYAKADPDTIHCRITAHNRGAEPATLHLLPTLWLRNTWGWGDDPDAERPRLVAAAAPAGAAWALEADGPALGTHYLYGAREGVPLFTENATHTERLFGTPNATPYVKDAFHRRVIAGEQGAVNPAGEGTKFAAWSVAEAGPGEVVSLDLVLSAAPLANPFAHHEAVLSARAAEADAFYANLAPEADIADAAILRQALAGLVWNKQFYHYDVRRWLAGDQLPPPPERRQGRNRHWRHLRARDILSMPDSWEYPWFAAWDLAFHIPALARLDPEFAKDQVEVLLSERYLHPNGQIPAYEWAFGDVNPPVHAMGALAAYRAERDQRGEGDPAFLERVFHKLLLNYAWWINRKDAEGHNLFEGGFLGLDNISVYDRSQPLPPGYTLKQADATGWMAMFALNMTVMALELCRADNSYEAMAIQAYEQFLAIAEAIAGSEESGPVSLWDQEAGFFKDVVVTPDGAGHHIDVYSWVGIIPLFAAEVVGPELLDCAPRFRDMLHAHQGGLFRGSQVCACPDAANERGEHLLALVDPAMLPPMLHRILAEDEFLSPHGVRSVSRVHAAHTDLGEVPGLGRTTIEYVPGESTSGLFGGNSNWRGPVWLPTNFALIRALEKFHRFLGDGFRTPAPCLSGAELTLAEAADLVGDRLLTLYRPGPDGVPPAHAADGALTGPAGESLLQFYEYFHAEDGRGLGAAHQTGWTGLLANLVLRAGGRGPTGPT
ncbi:MAG TPA: glucosidase [Gammaproteobacteria bacterium]|nr:glucosidase [Gammaproteobacteria bacterium]